MVVFQTALITKSDVEAVILVIFFITSVCVNVCVNDIVATS